MRINFIYHSLTFFLKKIKFLQQSHAHSIGPTSIKKLKKKKLYNHHMHANIKLEPTLINTLEKNSLAKSL
jgi:hypothetical protein